MAILPVFLTGALSVIIRTVLGFSITKLGISIAVFWAAMACMGAPGGRLVQYLGPTRSLRIGAFTAALSLAGASTSSSWAQLTTWLVVAGLSSGIAQPSTDLVLAHAVSPSKPQKGLWDQAGVYSCFDSRGWFGCASRKVDCGMAMDIYSLCWFGSNCDPLLPSILSQEYDSKPSPRPSGTQTRQLVLLTIGAAVATAAMTAMGAFYVESSVALGLEQGTAGAWLAMGEHFWRWRPLRVRVTIWGAARGIPIRLSDYSCWISRYVCHCE